jgi:hypothetical protein
MLNFKRKIRDLPLIARLLGSYNLDFIPKVQNPSFKAIFLTQKQFELFYQHF